MNENENVKTESAQTSPTVEENTEGAALTAESAENKAEDAVTNKTAAPQTKEKNAEYARRRREAERKAEISKARVDAIIEMTGGYNPYTSEEIKDAADAEQYLTQLKIERDGGDPISEFIKVQNQQRRDAEKKQAENDAAAERAEKELSDFVSDHPDVDVDALFKDEDFAEFADGKLGKKSLNEIYAGYAKILKAAERRATEKAAQAVANARASVGSLSSGSDGGREYFTREAVAKMSREEISRHFDAIMESKKTWTS